MALEQPRPRQERRRAVGALGKDMRGRLAAYRRLRILPDVKNCAARMSVSQFPNFRGKLREVESYCLSLINDGYKIKVFSETERNLQWAAVNGFEQKRGVLSEGLHRFRVAHSRNHRP